jgi:hypothetical protein
MRGNAEIKYDLSYIRAFLINLIMVAEKQNFNAVIDTEKMTLRSHLMHWSYSMNDSQHFMRNSTEIFKLYRGLSLPLLVDNVFVEMHRSFDSKVDSHSFTHRLVEI